MKSVINYVIGRRVTNNTRSEYDELVSPGPLEAMAQLEKLKSEFANKFDFKEDAFWVAYFLEALPNEFENLRVALTVKDTLTLAQLKEHMANENERQQDSKLASMSSNKSHCLICGKTNHVTDQCFKRYRDPSKYENRDQSNRDNRSNHQNRPGKFKPWSKKKASSNKPNETQESKQTNKREDEKLSAMCIEQDLNELNQMSSSTTKPWYIDSGATNHVITSGGLFNNLIERHDMILRAANGSNLGVAGVGDAEVKFIKTKMIMTGVTYSPGLNGNYLSVSRLVKNGYDIRFHRENGQSIANAYADGKLVFKAREANDMFRIEFDEDQLNNMVQSNPNTDELLNWHRRLGHLNFKALIRLKDQLNLKSISPLPLCDECALAKSNRLPFKSATTKTTRPLELIHTDTSGHIRVPNRQNITSFVTFTDDYSRYSFVYFLHGKNELLDVFKRFKTMIESKLELKIKAIKSDSGTEYRNAGFIDFCTQNGVELRRTMVKTPEQNGIAERLNRSIKEGATTLLLQSNLPVSFWPHAISYYIHSKNISPSSAVNYQIQHHLFFGEPPRYTDLRVFGCKTFCHKTETKHKFDSRAAVGYLVGYPHDRRGYSIYVPETNKIVDSRDVKFVESEFYDKAQCSNTFKPINLFCDPDYEASDDEDPSEEDTRTGTNNFSPNQVASPARLNTPQIDTSPNQRNNESSVADAEATNSKRIYNKRTVPITSNYDLRSSHQLCCLDPDISFDQLCHMEPKVMIDQLCYINPNVVVDQLTSGPDGENWKLAIEDEYRSLMSKNTWTLVRPPPGAQVIGSMWILREKFESDGKRYKARFVAKGFNQKDAGSHDTYAPVVHQSSVRLLMSHAITHNMKLYHIDVKTAYLNSNLNETIYIKQPYMFEGGGGGDGLVCKLNKAIYGLKQAARCWHNTLTNILQEIKFKQLLADSCVFVNEDRSTIVAVYVDDLLVICERQFNYEQVRDALAGKFKITDKGQVRQFLGMTIEQANNQLRISQIPYIESTLKRFNMADCKPVVTPIPTGTIIDPIGSDQDCDDVRLFQSIVGSLIYLANGSRPDIQFAVNKLCKYMATPKQKHLLLAKRIIRYLQKTINTKLIFTNPSSKVTPIEIFSDADFANDKTESKSISGVIVRHYGNMIRWTSHSQDAVAKSTCEAEVNSMNEAAQDAVYFKNLVTEIDPGGDLSPIIIWNDNQSAIKTIEGGGRFGRNRHYIVTINFIRSLVNNDTIKPQYRQTELMLADPLTKPLTESRINKLFSISGLHFG